eukprot:GHVP01046177.1.p1 GENE.GHVP01046177.1~~GHVP01046177.1.p1  ORF type:complete len:153 (+),score=42.18 GHVP01046177.1:561-1019(+)
MARDVIISPQYSCRDGMVGKREIGAFGQQSSDLALWWLELLPVSEKTEIGRAREEKITEDDTEDVYLQLHTDLKEGLFRFSVVVETDKGEEVAGTKFGGESFQKSSEKPVSIDFLNSDKISECLQLDDTLNIRCLIEIPTRVLTIEEKGANA